VRSELAVLAEQVSDNLDDMDTVIASSGVAAGEDGSDDGDDANQVTVLDPDAADSEVEEGETGAYDTANGGDHLDQILTGVATDLQLGESDDDFEDDSEETGYEDQQGEDEERDDERED
jgi:hypothetical protein